MTDGLARVINRRPTFLTLPAIIADISTPGNPNRTRDIMAGEVIGPESEKNVAADYIAFLEGELVLAEDNTLIPIGSDEDPVPHVTYAMWKEAGYFSVIREGDAGYKKAIEKAEGVKAPKDLNGFTEPQALTLVKAEDDKTVLRMWLKAERTRAKVRLALQTKLEG